MPERSEDVLEIPLVVDLAEFDTATRLPMRQSLGLGPEAVLIGWVGRLNRKKRVEDFLAAALLAPHHPEARFLVVGGPDAVMPEYRDEPLARADDLGLGGAG